MDSRRQSISDLGSPSPRPSPVTVNWNAATATGWNSTGTPEGSNAQALDPNAGLENAHGAIHGGTLQDRASREGRRNVIGQLGFIAKMMIPISIIAVMMFAVFALLAWLIPHVLCESSARALSGSSIGIYECIYVSNGDYSHITPSKIFWLMFWSFQTAWVAAFPGYIAYTLFGACVSRAQFLSTLVISAGCFATPMATALGYGMSLNNYIVLAVSAGGALMVNIICASSAVRFCEDPLMKWRWITLFMLAGQVNTVYLFVMPRLLTLRSSAALGGLGLAVIRVVVHPVIWTSVLFLFRSVQRHIGRVDNLKQTAFLVWPVLYATLYGRFLLLQLEDAGSIIMMNFLFACVQLGLMLQGRGSDALWLSWLYGKRARDAMEVSMEIDEDALARGFSVFSMELSSILAASALLTFGSVASVPGSRPDTGTIWFNAVAQLGTTIVFSSLEFVIGGKFHNYQWKKVYPKSVVKLMAYVLPVLVIGGSRLCVELLMLFCPKHYDEHGIMLEQCDKGTMFQHIKTRDFLARPAYQSVDGGPGGWWEFARREL